MLMKNKVAIVAPKLSGRGGTETVIFKMVTDQHLSKHNKFTVYLVDEIQNKEWINELENQGVEVVENTSHSKLGRFFFLAKVRGDIVIGLGPKTAYLLKIYSRIRHSKTRVGSWIHFSLFNSVDLNLKYLKKLDFHLAIANEIVNQFRQIGVMSHVYTIYNPVVIEGTQIPRSTNPNVFKMIYMGRLQLDGQKNLRELLLALDAFDADFNIELEVFGGGKELPTIKKYADTLKLANVHITWHGWTENAWKQLDAADALVLTSKFEGFPMVIAEALSFGVPVISMNTPVGPADMIVQGENGYIYKEHNYQDFAEAVQKLKMQNLSPEKVQDSIDWLTGLNYPNRVENAFEKILEIDK
ncbi:glycosyltransferase [Weissella confusa]|uniref:Glycosyl transferase family 1 domain-containing protein n=1 Tax=Weissella confusa TaxID=1583 RepID=A0A4Z0S1R1_WEICO|nr:glycosyltransferase [Weissella confusa]TGE71788.1 hypothetical protein C6P11_07775 [Weissella confusa]